jgi:hypothetical protein
MKFEELVISRLHHAEATMSMGIDIDAAAWEMMKGREYQNAKCDYGSGENDTETFSVTIPKLPRAYRNDIAGIVDGEMRFRRYGIVEWSSFSYSHPHRDDLRPLFDSQVS